MSREDYPRPDLVRKQWQNLNGKWAFAFDDARQGLSLGWQRGEGDMNQTINVPFAYQAKLSGIGDRTPHDHVWYRRHFTVDHGEDERVLLHFGAVDYAASVFVNGQMVIQHEGGETPFQVDVTAYLTGGQNLLAVLADDPHADETIPRGKQTWEERPRSIWYTNTTGIWQTVWLEVVPATYLRGVRFTPQYEQGAVTIDAALNQLPEQAAIEYRITFKGELVAEGRVTATARHMQWGVDLLQNHIFRSNFHWAGWSWTPEHPNLFEVALTVGKDSVASYFGLRKLSTAHGMVYLNNRPYYQKLVLDQGYWPDGGLTAPTDEAFKKDIMLAKAMGFNGCRKHQKVEDPRFLYWADHLGYLVWGECASAPVFNHDAVRRSMHEWDEIIARDYNHPSIAVWTPLNESWGVPNIQFDRQQQHFAQALYHEIHSLDQTRLVSGNDGWSQVETDLCTIHDYGHGEDDEPEAQAAFRQRLATPDNLLAAMPSDKRIFADGFSWQGQPMLLTECGGVSFEPGDAGGWGYTVVSSPQAYLKALERIVSAIYASPVLWGFCYTQLTDVEQEMNGLLTFDRAPKVAAAEIKKILDAYHPESVVSPAK